ncbi:hypothetical protein ASE63_18530 [Bosea sp. Root381]|uniref:hypothetical protein n=1 Tax=Bosea sp. Root381 TaxID=1736524 RepID=UPI0006F6CD72|nr:hypothetical protein [Bosea sp. Root381]KRE13470.1 hypothetical protein ASE63_18530 [Bosea sp. Root381]
MKDTPSKSFTSRKLDLQHRICADRRVTDGQFRMFVRVLRAMNERTGVAVIGDETIMAEVKSCGGRSTCKANRRHLQQLGYWKIEPGSGNRATEYTIDLSAGMALMNGLEDLRAERIQKRRRTTLAWRARKAVVGHTDSRLPDDVVGHVGDGVVGHVDSRQSAMQVAPYTFITPSTETPSYRAAEESRYLQGDDVDPDGVVIPRNFLSRLGAGDIEEGRCLADNVPAALLTMLLDRSSKFGASSIGAEIDNARRLALAAIERRASA